MGQHDHASYVGAACGRSVVESISFDTCLSLLDSRTDRAQSHPLPDTHQQLGVWDCRPGLIAISESAVGHAHAVYVFDFRQNLMKKVPEIKSVTFLVLGEPRLEWSVAANRGIPTLARNELPRLASRPCVCSACAPRSKNGRKQFRDQLFQRDHGQDQWCYRYQGKDDQLDDRIGAERERSHVADHLVTVPQIGK